MQRQLIIILIGTFAAILTMPLVSANSGPSIVDDQRSGHSLLSTFDRDTIPSPGIKIGVTIYDIQHNYAQGHQIGINTGGNTVHFVWSAWDQIPTSTESIGQSLNSSILAEMDIIERYVFYNSFDKQSATLNQGLDGVMVSLGLSAQGGMPRIDVSSDNRAHVALHQRPAPELEFRPYMLEFPVEGSSSHLDHQLDILPPEFAGLWADIAVEQNQPPDGTQDVVHVIASGAKFSQQPAPWAGLQSPGRYKSGGQHIPPPKCVECFSHQPGPLPYLTATGGAAIFGDSAPVAAVACPGVGTGVAGVGVSPTAGGGAAVVGADSGAGVGGGARLFAVGCAGTPANGTPAAPGTATSGVVWGAMRSGAVIAGTIGWPWESGELSA